MWQQIDVKCVCERHMDNIICVGIVLDGPVQCALRRQWNDINGMCVCVCGERKQLSHGILEQMNVSSQEHAWSLLIAFDRLMSVLILCTAPANSSNTTHVYLPLSLISIYICQTMGTEILHHFDKNDILCFRALFFCFDFFAQNFSSVKKVEINFFSWEIGRRSRKSALRWILNGFWESWKTAILHGVECRC